MPTKRKRVGHQSSLGVSEDEHVELGPEGHLLAGCEDCTLCGAPETAVRAAWTVQRDRLLANWRWGFPMWGQVRFDGVPLGPPREPLSVYSLIADQIE